MIEQKGEGVVDGFRIDQVVIIQNQDGRIRVGVAAFGGDDAKGGDFVEQGGEDRLR